MIRIGRDLINSEDGNRAFEFAVLVWRLACENGMVVPNNCFDRRVIHMGANALNRALEAVTLSLFDTDIVSTALGKAIETPLTEARLEKVQDYLERKGSKGFAKAVMTEYHNSPLEGPGETLYDLWNAVTHVAKSMGEQQRDIEKLSFNLLNMKLPKAA